MAGPARRPGLAIVFGGFARLLSSTNYRLGTGTLGSHLREPTQNQTRNHLGNGTLSQTCGFVLCFAWRKWGRVAVTVGI